MTRAIILLSLITVFISACTQKENTFSQWRGHNRDGIFTETGLLKVWPEEGPQMLWSAEGLGYGQSSAAVANGKVYVTGIKDTLTTTGTLFVFDLEGNRLWEKDYGPDFCRYFHGARSTPTVVDDLIYIESGMGTLYCLNSETGEVIWTKDFLKDFGVDSVIQFGYAESVLIDGDNLICTPGGKENNVVKLNRFSGEKVWSSKGFGEQATYNSPILIEYNGQRLVIATTCSSIMGIDAENGQMYWRIEHTQGNKIHANTPVYSDGKILMATPDVSDTSGMIMIQLSDDGKQAEVVWRNKKLRNFMGGLIKRDTCIYASAYLRNSWQVLSWNTGEMLTQNKELGGGAIIYADGLFYCYSERDGEIALADASSGEFNFISRFKVPMGTKEHWAHPVISNGKLFVRHGDALMVYDIQQKTT